MSDTAFDRVVDAFRAQGLAVDERRDRATAQAPGHSAVDRSVTLTREIDRVLVHSHSDETADVLAAVGLTFGDLYDNPKGTISSEAFARREPTPEQVARKSRRMKLDKAHAESFNAELAEAERIAAEENPGTTPPDWTNPKVLDPSKSLLRQMFNGAWLDAQQFPDLEEVVEGILVEGFSLIVGPPKVGKSWLIANLAVACASGGMALGAIQVKKRPVLDLALEDGPRRLQSRLRTLTNGAGLPECLDMLCQVEPGMVTPTIAEWLERHRDEAPLVILDTLGKARPQRRSGDDPYLADYQFGSKLKRLVDDVPGAALLVVHHTNKGDSGDFVDAVSGTQGIAGSADSVLVLRRQRKSDEGTLSVTGRDVVEREIALVTSGGRWQLDGFTIESATERVEERQQRGELGDKSLDVLRVVMTASGPVKAAEVAESAGIHPDHARKYLKRLADSGRIHRAGRGLYVGVPTVTSVPNEQKSDQNGTQGTDVTPLFPEDQP